MNSSSDVGGSISECGERQHDSSQTQPAGGETTAQKRAVTHRY